MSCQWCCIDLLQAELFQSAPDAALLGAQMLLAAVGKPCLPKEQGGHCRALWGKGRIARLPPHRLANWPPSFRHSQALIAWHYKSWGLLQSQICRSGPSLPSSHCTALLPCKCGPLHSPRSDFTQQLGLFIRSWQDAVLTCYGLTIRMNRNRYSLQKDVYDFITE